MRSSIFILLATLIISGCASKQSFKKNTMNNQIADGKVNISRLNTDLSALMDAYNDWRGSPYRFGGNDRSGIDCSAFTQRIYQRVYGRYIPRTTAYQHRIGQQVTVTELEPGDLVFFRPEANGRHVGIYLDEGRFMHASSSAGVTISSLYNPWWRSVYWKSVRP